MFASLTLFSLASRFFSLPLRTFSFFFCLLCSFFLFFSSLFSSSFLCLSFHCFISLCLVSLFLFIFSFFLFPPVFLYIFAIRSVLLCSHLSSIVGVQGAAAVDCCPRCSRPSKRHPRRFLDGLCILSSIIRFSQLCPQYVCVTLVVFVFSGRVSRHNLARTHFLTARASQSVTHSSRAQHGSFNALSHSTHASRLCPSSRSK